jgi:hypothetical protein
MVPPCACVRIPRAVLGALLRNETRGRSACVARARPTCMSLLLALNLDLERAHSTAVVIYMSIYELVVIGCTVGCGGKLVVVAGWLVWLVVRRLGFRLSGCRSVCVALWREREKITSLTAHSIFLPGKIVTGKDWEKGRGACRLSLGALACARFVCSCARRCTHTRITRSAIASAMVAVRLPGTTLMHACFVSFKFISTPAILVQYRYSVSRKLGTTTAFNLVRVLFVGHVAALFVCHLRCICLALLADRFECHQSSTLHTSRVRVSAGARSYIGRLSCRVLRVESTCAPNAGHDLIRTFPIGQHPPTTASLKCPTAEGRNERRCRGHTC